MKWFCIRTEVNCEFKAERSLAEEKFETFLPTGKKYVVKSRRKVERVYPLFSRYLFVRNEPAERGFYAIKSADGVEGILGVAGLPLAVPDIAIESVRRLVDIGVFDKTITPELKPGTRVIIAEGPFFGHIGELQNDSNEPDAEVFLSLFGRVVAVSVPFELVRGA
jgi:transcriptional antiterminator RfaH